MLYLICFGVPMLLALYAQGLVKTRYAQASKVPATFIKRNGTTGTMTGAEAARIILDSAGLQRIPIQRINAGALTNYYDPQNKRICLSGDIYGGSSLADVGIAAHEAGHAMQDAENYIFLGMTQKAFPIARFGSQFSFWLLAIGLGANMMHLAWAGVALFGAVALYQIINLPVEYNASNRAKKHLASLGIVNEEGLSSIRKVLGAAALTYVAAMLTSLFQFFYFLLRVLASSQRREE
ncbi:MAG: zinc metallopeptidase [Thermoguttaceae bacterium]|nr:zinc metallopeptidase [Thermoguttaceae bacterium]